MVKYEGFSDKMYYRERSLFFWVPRLFSELTAFSPVIILSVIYYIGGVIPMAVFLVGALCNLYDEIIYPKNINQMPAPRKQRCKVKKNVVPISKKVAVIGAGPCGLVSVKEMLDEGHDVTCFEGSDGIGGTFYSYFWPNGRLVSSPYVTCFSDFEAPKQADGSPKWDHLTALEYVAYLKNYANHFKVTEHIKFHTKVLHVKRDENHKYWMETSVDGGTSTMEGPFDHVVVTTGSFHVPHMPRIPGLESFTGKIRHSRDFGAPPGTPLETAFADCAGKNVLAVGLGESLADILYLISCKSQTPTKTCNVSVRAGAFVFPRRHIMFNTVTDLATARTRHAIPKFLRNILHVYPIILLSVFGVRLCTRFRCLAYCIRHLKSIRCTYNKSTKSDDFSLAVGAGKLNIKGMIDRIEKNTVYFKDGSTLENVDVMIFGTGYGQPKFPMFDKNSFPDEAANGMAKSNELTPLLESVKCRDMCDNECPVAACGTRRYLRIIDPKYGDGLGFIGLGVRPLLGAIPPIAEEQARLYALVVSGKLELPKYENMLRRIKRDLKDDIYEFARDNEYWEGLVNHVPYLDILAREVGNLPKRSFVYTRPKLFWKMMVGGPFSTHYRLCGPHAKPEWAADIIRKGPIEVPFPVMKSIFGIKMSVALCYWPVTFYRLGLDILDRMYNFVVRD